MRIALLTPQWAATTGGPSKYVANLQRELSHLGHTVSVMTTDSGDGAILLPNRGGHQMAVLFSKLRKFRPDVIHIHGRLQFIPAAMLYRRFSSGSRIVFTFHTQPYIRSFLPNARPGTPDYVGLKRVLASWLLARCDAVTSVSASIVSNLNTRYQLGIKNAVTIPSAGAPHAPSTRELERIRDRLQLSRVGPIVSSVGVFSWDWKIAGHELAIRAIARLAVEFPRIRLLIAGDGFYRGYLENLVDELGMGSHVLFLGNAPAAEVIELADVYLHMASHEGCSLAIIEAMFAGKPIVASTEGGTPEILQDGVSAYLRDADPDRVASAVSELLRAPDVASSLGQEARRRAEKGLSWPHVARQYDHLFQSVA
jgi:glycosyltransferase involved in cell wall biosynthesis